MTDTAQLVESHLWLALAVARSFSWDETVEAAAVDGLLKAGRKHNYTGRFESFARRCIRFHVLDRIRTINGRTEAGKARLGTNLTRIGLDDVIGDHEYSLAETIPDERAVTPDRAAMHSELRPLLKVANLNRNEAFALEEFFFKGEMPSKIAPKLNVTPARVSQIVNKAVHKIRLAS
jgi:RNA polymerase sigma factor (sigma-70 family)